MNGKKLIQSLHLKNVLSYGEHSEPVLLEPLNVLIGLNATGKSNFIEAIGLLAAAPKDLLAPIRQGGGVGEWLWKGVTPEPVAEINATIYNPYGSMPLRHVIRFTKTGQRFELVDEAVENEKSRFADEDPYFYYRYQDGHPVLNIRTGTESPSEPERHERNLQRQDVSLEQSVLSQRKDPDQYPELTYLGNQYQSIKFFREWNFGRFTAPRLPQNPDLPEDFLMEDASNLGLVLNDLLHLPDLKQTILKQMGKFHEQAEDIYTRIHGGTVQVFMHEAGLRHPVPATRLSDGTLHFLCLLTILCHPKPPPLVCIEEPEIGLHPDALPLIAELLKDAAERTQLIVTTHSELLVSALSDVPESVLVCEHDEAGTTLCRRDRSSLEEWLKKYSLGELWLMGELGGVK